MRGNVGKNWTWHGANADQGLLYYWTKYVKKSVSIMNGHDIEQWDTNNWSSYPNGTLILQQKQHGKDGAPTTIIKKALKSYGCPVTRFLPPVYGSSPYNDFYHMTGSTKPWYRKRMYLEDTDCMSKKKGEFYLCNTQAKWYQMLKDALVSIEMIDHVSWNFFGSRDSAPVGHTPTHEKIAKYIYAKKQRNWNQYKDGSISFDAL